MNNIEDIAKLAIKEISAELDFLENSKNDNSGDNAVLNKLNDNENFTLNKNNENSTLNEVKNDSTSTDYLKNDAKPIKAVSSLKQNENNLDKNTLENNQNIKNENALEQNANKLDDERKFLNNLKERIEVLFTGLNANDEKTPVRLDLTIRFLEFLLASIQNRLENLPK